MVKPVGFDQRVFLHHLDYTALQARTNIQKDMYAILDGYLRNDIKGSKSRKNAITMLMKIWYRVGDETVDLRNNILEKISDLNQSERLLVHWLMTMNAYPFFKDVAMEFGRLFQLQEDVSSKVIGDRMKSIYGDRRRVEVATGAVLSSMRAWGVIRLTKGRYNQKGNIILINNTDLQTYIIKMLFKIKQSNSLYINNLHALPLLFPFNIELDLVKLREEKDFSLFYQGVDDLILAEN